MKNEYDFSRAKRGTIAPAAKGKTRITIRVDDEILDWFRQQVHAEGGGNYQTQINLALKDHITRQDNVLADTLRRVLREEIAAYNVKPAARAPRGVAISSPPPRRGRGQGRG
jgi:BrnA antitoxin of type II toxin-antitoxin system